MSETVEKIQSLEAEGLSAIGSAETLADLEETRIHYLGRKSPLNEILKSIATLPPEEKGPVGTAGNQTRGTLGWRLGSHHLSVRWIAKVLDRG